MATKKAPAKKTAGSVYHPDFHVVTAVLREFREKSGLTQIQFAAKLGRSQAYVSSAERLSRLDTLQLRAWCAASGLSFVDFATEIDKRLGKPTKAKRLSK